MLTTGRRQARRLLVLAVVLAAGTGITGCSRGPFHSGTRTPTTKPDRMPTTVAPVSATPTTDCVGIHLDEWSLAELAAQTVVVPADETEVQAVAAAVADGAGGIILFGSSAPTDLGKQLATVEKQTPTSVRPFVMTDEEGGDIQRMANLVGNLPWPRTMAQTMSPDQVRHAAATVGAAMKAVGVTMDLAPVLDLASGPGPDATHTDGPRSFSADAQTASTFGVSFARGLEDAGVLPVAKHFPGEGSASANTDDAPASSPPLDTLIKSDLLPFRAAITAGMPAVMVGNATVPGLSAQPAALSSAVITGLLRDQLSFDGLVLTDSLSAGAVSAAGYDVPSAAVAALGAGADMVLFNAPPGSGSTTRLYEQVTAAIVHAVDTGTVPRPRLVEAATHILAAKKILVCPGSDHS